MKRSAIIHLAFASASLVQHAAAPACPLCDSPTAEKVRAGLFDANLADTLAGIAAPFSIAAVVAAYLLLPARVKEPPRDAEP